MEPFFTDRMQQADMRHGCLLDGFPRTVRQAERMPSLLPPVYSRPPFVLHLFTRRDLLIRKITCRRVCEKCGANYNVAHIMEGDIRMPALLPKREGLCDKCDGKLVQREDDKLETVQKRLDLYSETTEPVVDYYRKHNHVIDFELISGVDDMWPKLKTLISNTIPNS
eukprot:TRINITY_DN9870_c0_g1_i4.p1 TRINITY_DN9870_c0_g1~~TRINITY_DN9870_c0_g1_i4.p1  ORF type:complete len:167 (-),score=26.40 TRINITY_DN9870_c0_g1_i4:43-543(-)